MKYSDIEIKGKTKSNIEHELFYIDLEDGTLLINGNYIFIPKAIKKDTSKKKDKRTCFDCIPGVHE